MNFFLYHRFFRNNLKNDDFRKFLSTPSAHSLTSSSTKSTVRQHGASFFSHKQTAIAAANSATKNKQKRPFRPPPKEKDEKDTIFDESQAKLNEVLLKYRDRASERRKGMVPEDEDLRNRLAVRIVLPFNENIFNSFLGRI
jgi:hypothetical protein